MKAFITILIIVLAVLGLWWLVGQDTPDPVPGNGDSSEQTVRVYFYNESEDVDETGNIACSPDAVQFVERTVPADTYEDNPVEIVLEELFEGPTGAEQERGFSSEFPLDRVEVESIEVSDGEAVVTLSDPENATSGGSCRVTLLRAQVEKTIQDAAGTEEVVLQPETLFQP